MPNPPDVLVTHAIGKFIAVTHHGVERLRYVYDPSVAPKPFLHPIRSPDGHPVTALSPLDHFWHRGLWLTWKFVNGVNYWEENQEIVGRQITLRPPIIEPTEEDGVRWTSDIAWRDTRDGGAERTRIVERRTITCRFTDDETLILDWISQQTLQQDTVLDRTPFTTWGGYGGLVVRLTQALQKQQIVLASGDTTAQATGQAHNWAAIAGQLDTATSPDLSGPETAFLFLPSARNRRFPEPMYGDARPFYNFFGPAPLFHEPMTLSRGETLRYACRVVVLAGRVDPRQADGYYRNWQESEGESDE